ncbi:MAG TPA: hypothetical protein VJZ71_05705 [Phycisphaerae bacterium]|nr:hypothetical protein [Phycisphaerae bacterium]
MNFRPKVVIAVVFAFLLVLIGVYWWRSHDVSRYGGVKPYMEGMHKHYMATAVEMKRSGDNLPADFTEMERLAQTAQDIYAVFAPDPRSRDAKFTPSARELIRQATLLEQSWDDGRPEDARAAFVAMAEACNSCHRAIAESRPPTIVADQVDSTQ